MPARSVRTPIRDRHAWDEIRSRCRQRADHRSLPVRPATSAHHRGRDLPGALAGPPHRGEPEVVPWAAEWRAPGGRRAGGRRARGRRPAAAADRVRRSLDLRRDPAGTAGHAARAALAGHPAFRGEFARLGPAPGELGRHLVDLPPDPGLGGGGLDPGRDRPVAGFRPAGPVGQVRRAGQRRLGTGGLGIRRGLRRHFRARPDLAVRRAGRRSAVLRRRGAAGAAGEGLAHPPARQAHARRPGSVFRRHGGAAGLAGPRFLAGQHARPAGHAHRHDPEHESDAAAALPRPDRLSVRGLHRRTRLRGQPVHRHRAGRHRRRLPQRAAAAGPARRRRRDRALPRGLGADRGSLASSAAWAPTRTA